MEMYVLNSQFYIYIEIYREHIIQKKDYPLIRRGNWLIIKYYIFIYQG